MNITKSVRVLETEINAAPQYDSNDDVSDENEKIVSCVFIIMCPSHDVIVCSLLVTLPLVDGDGVLSSIALWNHLRPSG
jgi:hypothetical protein